MEELQSISILFLLARNRMNKKGLCPIRCRITLNGERKIFSTGLFLNPDNWNSKKQITKPPNEENQYINTQLSLIKNKINQAFLLLQMQEADGFDVNDIYDLYKGKSVAKKNKTLLQMFDIHNRRMEKLVGIEYNVSTYKKFLSVKNTLKGFIRFQYKTDDYPLRKLDMKFLTDLDFYLKSEKEQKQVTINKTIQRLRKIVKLAVGEGYLEKDPFLLYKSKKTVKRLVYLTVEELGSLEEYTFSQKRLEQVKDMFVFCCYTGLPYTEMANLRSEHIVKGFDDCLWIKMTRQKTGGLVSVPLLPQALAILEKYEGKNENLLPIISNQKFNSYLKEIAVVVGIEKNLTHHIARKTFATTVLLYNDVPMEIVSELLGHSSMQVTQEHYAKVVQKKLSEQMMKLKDKLTK